MRDNFPQAFDWVMEHEGGFTNDPRDPGGMTNLGVTAGNWAEWLGRSPTEAEMRKITREDAKPFYKARYWDKARCDDLPSGIDYAVFDYGVNSGPGRAVRALQKALDVTADGACGPMTVAAAKNADAKAIIQFICDERLHFLQQLSTFPIFGKGWTQRVADVAERAEAMV